MLLPHKLHEFAHDDRPRHHSIWRSCRASSCPFRSMITAKNFLRGPLDVITGLLCCPAWTRSQIPNEGESSTRIVRARTSAERVNPELAVGECRRLPLCLQHGLSRDATRWRRHFAGNVAKWQQSLLIGIGRNADPGPAANGIIIRLARSDFQARSHQGRPGPATSPLKNPPQPGLLKSPFPALAEPEFLAEDITSHDVTLSTFWRGGFYDGWYRRRVTISDLCIGLTGLQPMDRHAAVERDLPSLAFHLAFRDQRSTAQAL